MGKLLREFREFAVKGNAIDLAVGIIIGAAFGKIVNSIVSDLIMPIVGLATGGVDFSDRFINLSRDKGPFDTLAAAKEAGAATLNYGAFLDVVLEFLIVAWAVFMLVKGINALRRKEAAKPDPTPPAPTREEQLLGEIRDLLRSGRA